MDRTEDEFVSLQDAIALVTYEFSEGSNVTKILEALMKVMITGKYEYDDDSLSELEELCR
jgi:hypothetical protein